MSTVAVPRASTVFTDEPLFRLTVEQYHQLIESGALGDADPVELVEGALLYKMPRKTPHVTGVRRCRRVFTPRLPAGYFYDSEQPVTLVDGEPEPDGAVLRGDIDDYADAHPGPAAIVLLVEVADSTLGRDRGIKLVGYARSGIPAYWILNLVDRQVEVYTDPGPSADLQPTYRCRTVYPDGASVPLVIDGVPLPDVAVSSVLPPIGTGDA